MRPMVASHRFVEHTSEVELELQAGSLGELLAEAARALGELLLHGDNVRLHESQTELELAAHDEAALLVDWLNELVYFAEAERWVPLDGEVTVERDDEGCRLRARLRRLHVERAPSQVKAATLHGVRVVEAEGRVTANVILDV